MIYEQRSRNLWLSRAIGLSFIAVVVFIIYCAVVLIFGGDYFWLALVLTLVIALMVVGYLKSDRWVLGRFTSQVIDPPKRAREALQEMAIAAGIRTPILYVMDLGTLNAFAVGRDRDRGIVVVTKGLIDHLDEDELRAVLAHEVAHIRDGDSMAGSLIAVIVWAANRVFAASWVLVYAFATAPEVMRESPLLAVLPVVCLMLPLGGRIAQMTFSRSREYLADNSSVLLTRDPEGLIGALGKMDELSSVVARSTIATSHLFISSPNSIWNTELLSTHPPMAKRIHHLRHVTAVPVSDVTA